MIKISSNYLPYQKMRDRRIYEIVSKYCSNQREFTTALKKLQLRTESNYIAKNV